MLQVYLNIYQAGRNAAGITQEKAAELLGISVESVRDYENGRRYPQNGAVAKMIEIYNTPYLAIQHINNSAKELSAYLPQVSLSELPGAVLKLQKEVTDFMKLRDELVEITCDGVISADERLRFDIILKELDDVTTAIMSLKYARTV